MHALSMLQLNLDQLKLSVRSANYVDNHTIVLAAQC
jgi:hypothetical protein